MHNRSVTSNKAQTSRTRRSFLIAAATQLVLTPFAAAKAAAPSTQQNSAAVEEFRKVTALQDLAFEYTNQLRFSDAEILWTKLIALNENNAAAYSNRGNCRTSQAKFDEAIEDFSRAIRLAPEEPDSYLGLGVALEGLRKYEDALQAYQTSNELSVKRFGKADAVALNNMGNAYGGLNNWKQAYEYYKRAALTENRFVFALANQALAELELRMDEDAMRTMRFLTRKYPRFGDMHAAMAMVLWERGDGAEAEEEWFKAVETDGRYVAPQNLESVRSTDTAVRDRAEQVRRRGVGARREKVAAQTGDDLDTLPPAA
ncbi:tetratricopeptide repeat protein [Gracilaria domingensis]|nr:tetratricopeptide repeat protein [Gracilaria domingensis]